MSLRIGEVSGGYEKCIGEVVSLCIGEVAGGYEKCIGKVVRVSSYRRGVRRI